MASKHRSTSRSLFHELNITTNDYAPIPKQPTKYFIPPEICTDLHTIFLHKLYEAVEFKDWDYAVEDGVPRITVNFDSMDIHPNESWEFIVDAGIPQTIDEETKKSGIIPVHYHVSLHRSDKPWTEVSDVTKGGEGQYDPCVWAHVIIDMIEKYCLSERITKHFPGIKLHH